MIWFYVNFYEDVKNYRKLQAEWFNELKGKKEESEKKEKRRIIEEKKKEKRTN